MRGIQDKQDLDLERDLALRHSPVIMHQQSGFLGIKLPISNKQGSSLEPRGTQRELERGKKKVGLSVYQPKNYIKGVCKEANAKTGVGRKKETLKQIWYASYLQRCCT